MPPSKNSAETTMEPATIIFVRHGTTPTTGKVLPGRAPGLHLSEEGKAQAEVVGKALAELTHIKAIYTSPLERARETAAPLAQHLDLEPIVTDGFAESDPGEWTGKDLEWVRTQAEWIVLKSQPSAFCFPGGESWIEMQARVVSAVNDLSKAHPGEVVAVFSHLDPIAVAINSAMGSHTDLVHRVYINPARVSVITYTEEHPVVITINSDGASASELLLSNERKIRR